MRKSAAVEVLTVLFLIFAGAFTNAAPLLPPETAFPDPIRIVYQGSVQGRLQGMGGGPLGGGKAAVEAARQRFPGTLFLSCGNMLGPSAFSVSDGGAGILRLMEKCGFDAMAPGPHDFFGGSALLTGSAPSFPLILSNLDSSKNSALGERFKPWIKLQQGNRTVLIMGIIDPAVISDWPGWNPDLVITDPVAGLAAARKEAGDADFTLVLGTVRFPTGQRILKESPWVDLVITNQMGAEEVLDDVSMEYRLVDGRGMAWSFHPGKILGSVTAERTENRLKMSVEPHPIATINPGDPEFVETVASIEADTRHKLGSSTGTLSPSESRAFPTVLLDALRCELQAEVAFIHSGALPDQAAEEPVSEWNIRKWFPFPDRVALVEITGTQLAGLWKRRNSPLVNDRGLSFAGVREHRGSIIVNDRRFKPGDRYRVATVEFLAKGGLGLLPPSPKTVRAERFNELLIRHFAVHTDGADRASLARSTGRKTITYGKTNIDVSFSKFNFEGAAGKYQYTDPSAVYRGSDIPGLVGIRKRQQNLSVQHETIFDHPGYDLILRGRATSFEFNKLKMVDNVAATARYETKSVLPRNLQKFGQMDLVGTIKDPDVKGKRHPFFGKAVGGIFWEPAERAKILAGIGYMKRFSMKGSPSNTGLNLGYEFVRPFRDHWELSSTLDFFASADSDRIRMYDGTLALRYKFTDHVAAVIRESDFGWKDSDFGKLAKRREYFLGLTFEQSLRRF